MSSQNFVKIQASPQAVGLSNNGNVGAVPIGNTAAPRLSLQSPQLVIPGRISTVSVNPPRVEGVITTTSPQGNVQTIHVPREVVESKTTFVKEEIIPSRKTVVVATAPHHHHVDHVDVIVDPCKKPKDPCDVKYCGPTNLCGHLLNWPLWAAFIIAIILAALVFWAIHRGASTGYWDSLEKHGLSPNTQAIIPILVVEFLLLIWIAYEGHIGADCDPCKNDRNLLSAVLLFHLAAFAIWASVFFHSEDPRSALVIGFVAFALGIWWLYLLWPYAKFARWALIAYLAIFIYLLWVNYDIIQRNDL